MGDALDNKLMMLITDLDGLDRHGKLKALRTFLEHEQGLATSVKYLDPYDLTIIREAAARTLSDWSFGQTILGETFSQNPDLHRTAAFFTAIYQYLKGRNLLGQELGFREADRRAKPCRHGNRAPDGEGHKCLDCKARVRPAMWVPEP